MSLEVIKIIDRSLFVLTDQFGDINKHFMKALLHKYYLKARSVYDHYNSRHITIRHSQSSQFVQDIAGNQRFSNLIFQFSDVQFSSQNGF